MLSAIYGTLLAMLFFQQGKGTKHRAAVAYASPALCTVACGREFLCLSDAGSEDSESGNGCLMLSPLGFRIFCSKGRKLLSLETGE